MADAKVIIKGQNNLKSATVGAKNDLAGLSSSVQKFSSVLKTVVPVTLILGGIKKITGAVGAMLTEDFGEANRAYKQLALSIGDSSAYNSVIENMNAISK